MSSNSLSSRPYLKLKLDYIQEVKFDGVDDRHFSDEFFLLHPWTRKLLLLQKHMYLLNIMLIGLIIPLDILFRRICSLSLYLAIFFRLIFGIFVAVNFGVSFEVIFGVLFELIFVICLIVNCVFDLKLFC